ncbi:hypothetical protein OJ998_22830 [Solirubrobacter taibaiensis]|nr:hypothetical protein [Solirubrobacter taibaiensis]
MSARLLLAMVSLLLAPVSADASEVLATVPGAERLSAYDGWIVLSVAGPDQQRRLVTWHDGVVAPLNVRPNPDIFDHDVGPDTHGRPTVVYSRCVRRPRGCDLFAVTLGEGVERRLPVSRARTSEFAPAIWGDMLVFGRRAAGRRRADVVLTQAGRPVRRLGVGTLPSPCADVESCEGPGEGFPSESDLGPEIVAYNWRLVGGNAIFGDSSELRVARLDGRRARIAAVGWGDGTCGAGMSTPSVAGTGVRYGRSSCGTTSAERFELAGLRRFRAPVPDAQVYHALAWDGDVLYDARFTGELVRLGPPAWQEVRGGEPRPPLEG